MKAGSEYDPGHLTDMTLTGYRDAIDYLGYYRDTYGSMIEGIGMEAFLAKKVLADRATKVMGVRINCVGRSSQRPTRHGSCSCPQNTSLVQSRG